MDDGTDSTVVHPSPEELAKEPESVAAMVDWFFDTYEDPVENTPHDSQEGGYQYIWGGPYSAWEELEAKFPEANEQHIARAVEMIERCGTTEWTKHPDSEDPPELGTEDEVRALFVRLITFVAKAKASHDDKNNALQAIEVLQARLLP